MPITVTPVTTTESAAQGLAVAWEGCQFVMIVAARGLVSCGVIDCPVMQRFGAAVAVARGTPERPLKSPEDLLEAKIQEVTEPAAALGVTVGMTGREALEKLS